MKHYPFDFKQEANIIIATFTKVTNTQYRVYFYPCQEYLTNINTDSNLYRSCYFFGFTKLSPNERKIEPIDLKVRNTILSIIHQFFSIRGQDHYLLFFCDNDDNKNLKRAKCFDLWYRRSDFYNLFVKLDEEIVYYDEQVNTKNYEDLSLILPINNPQNERIQEEFLTFKSQLFQNK